MRSKAKQNLLVIGVGNQYRSDDGAGLIVARRLEKRNLDGVTVIEQSGLGIDLMETWKDATRVILIDAVRSGAKPGTVYRFDANSESIPAHFIGNSTHAIGVADAVELAKELGRLPSQLIVYGIEGKNYDNGTELSPEIEDAVNQIVEYLLEEV